MIDSVSLCMVVYNESHRIYMALLRALGTCDEIVIVDQSSTDNTIEEIEKFSSKTNIPVKIITDKHWGYCEPSRKLAHQHSSGDWILVLDADEATSLEFRLEMREIDEKFEKVYGCRLKRSLWIAGQHSWTGDYQYRFFRRDKVRYLDEIHTEPQPTTNKDRIYCPDYVGIIHTKSWTEQIRDESAYMDILEGTKGALAEKKKDISSIYTKILEAAGISAAEADAMTPEQRRDLGISSPYEF